MKIVRIDYTLRDDASIDALKAAIATFVAGIRAHHPSHEYTSFQSTASPRRFTHLGKFEPSRLPDLQAQPFFGQFSAFLKAQCASGPDATWLEEIATTR